MFIVLIIGCALLLDGLHAINRFSVLKFQREQSQSWPSTTGKIIQSKVKAIRVAVVGKKRGADGRRMAFSTDIVYSYHANGDDFESRQLYFGQAAIGNFKGANKRAEQYPEGSEVTVYYNPENPEMAILDRKRDSGLSLYLINGSIFIALGLVMVIAALKGMLGG